VARCLAHYGGALVFLAPNSHLLEMFTDVIIETSSPMHLTLYMPHEPSQGPHFLHGHSTSGACYVRGRLNWLDFLAARLRYGAEWTHGESGLNVPSELSAL